MRTSEATRQRVREALGELRASRGGAAAHNKLWEEGNPVKAAAHKRVEAALVSGRLGKAPCVICGENAHAHHEDYSKPLRVIWLCAAHHKDRHAALDAGLAEDWTRYEVEAKTPNSHGRSGHPNITWLDREQVWQVRVRRKDAQIRKTFKQFGDAVAFRDSLEPRPPVS